MRKRENLYWSHISYNVQQGETLHLTRPDGAVGGAQPGDRLQVLAIVLVKVTDCRNNLVCLMDGTTGTHVNFAQKGRVMAG